MKYTVNSNQSKADFMSAMEKLYDEHKFLRIEVKTGKQRTNRQNAALHLYLTQLAKALNDAGLDMKRTLKQEVDIPWNMELAKQYLWRPIQKLETGKESTTQPEAKDYPLIYETLNRHLSDKFGISIPWPEMNSAA